MFLDLGASTSRCANGSTDQEYWRAHVMNFTLELVKEQHDRAITRDLEWGVPIPVGLRGDDKRIYVWFEKSSATSARRRSGPRTRARRTPGRTAGRPDAPYYFIGKDNIWFHSVSWPAQLLGYGDAGTFGAGRGRLQPPYDIVSSEFLTMEGRQFSTSRGVVIYVGDFLSRYDPDALRYFLTAAGPETQDTDFTWAEFVRRNNDELVANWGNLVNRTLTSAYKNFGRSRAGVLPDGDRR